jgi:hypothetical protein
MELLQRMAANREKTGQIVSMPNVSGDPPTFRMRKHEIIEKKPAKKVVLKFLQDLIDSMVESDSDID